MPSRRPDEEAGASGRAARVAVAIGRHPREFVAVVMATAATAAIFINALFLQKGPHPAPIFVTRPLIQRPVPIAPPRPQSATPAAPDTASNRTQLVAEIQRELLRRGFYDGAVDGVWGAKTDSAARDFAAAAGVSIDIEASEALLHAILSSGAKHTDATRPNDPIAQLIAPTPSKRVLAVQRALADYGYGQLKPTGVYDAPTRTAIERFERDRRLPITGRVSDALVRDLEAMTGRPLE